MKHVSAPFGLSAGKREGATIKFDAAGDCRQQPEPSCWMELRLGRITRAEVHKMVDEWLDGPDNLTVK